MEDPKVSVIMSVYNGEKYLREAIDSILNQTFKDFEFIIINDGSTDKTREILESYKDDRIILINQENLGLTKSLNKGIKMARGEYIARQDADDISHPKRLSCQVDLLDNQSEIVLVGTNVSYIDQSGREFKIWKVPKIYDQIKKKLMETNCFCHGSVMFRKICLNTVGFYRKEFKYTQDYDLWLRISEHYKVVNISELLYKLRINSNSISLWKKAEQGRYAELARELARERRKFGKDSLQRGDRRKIDKILKDISSRSWIEKRKDLAYGYYEWADYLFGWNHLKDCRRFVMKSLLFYPFNHDAWRLLVLCSLPTEVIKMVRKIKKIFLKAKVGERI